MITKEEIKKDLIRVSEIISKIPSKEEYKEHGLISNNTVIRRYTTWNNALTEIFGKVNHRNERVTHIITCDQCGKEFERSDDKLKDINFCSVVCSNKGRPKRKLTNQCERCEELIYKKDKFCTKCKDEYIKENSIKQRTLESFKHLKGPSKYSQIREDARNEATQLSNVCVNCGYDKHVEVCHKKPIPSFDTDTLIEEINALDNLVKLCKNCHWETHNGYLDINNL